MRVGEGTGAVATFPLYDMIAAVYARQVRFEDKGVEPYKELV
jgi:nicotinate-nucleotide--dimethylbenzimidazole phosphoribosyltransferase